MKKKKKSLAASPAVRALLLQPRLVNAREAVIESRNLYALDPIWFEMMTMGHHHRKNNSLLDPCMDNVIMGGKAF